MEVTSREARAYSKVLNKAKLDSNKRLTLVELTEELYNAFNTDIVDIDHVQQLMSAYRSDPQDWKKYAKFDRYR